MCLQRHRESDRPAVRSPQRAANRIRIRLASEAALRKRERVLLSELQIPGNELGKLAVRAPARKREGRLDARAEQERDMVRQALDQRFEQRVGIGALDAMQVVEDEQDPVAARGTERIDEGSERRAAL